MQKTNNIYKNILIGMLACFFVLGCIISSDDNRKSAIEIARVHVSDPMNATYIIEGQEIRLVDGRCETRVVPGSATKVITSVFGKPVYGNLNGKGGVDTTLILVHDSGGSGTFYYVAAAINVDGGFLGTRAIFIGDRVAVQNVTIRNGMIVVDYADRRPDDSMSVLPTVAKSKHLVLDGNVLKETSPLSKGEEILDGWVVIGHELRSFIPCSQTKEFWFNGDSPALNKIITTYRKTLPDSMPYTPLFMTLIGRIDEPVLEGFGADYEASFFVKKIVQVLPQGNCKSNLIYVESPLPGARISSPFRIQGYARGKWFFEGDFPVLLANIKGEFIGKGYATAKDAWMTEMFVPFESVITFKPQKPGSQGVLILKKDNPTGQSKFDDTLEIPIIFN